MAVRLDKYLAQAGFGTRSEVKKLIRSGRVLLNGKAAQRPEEKVPAECEISVDGKRAFWSEYEYFMLNKPKGVVSATRDAADKTVVDLITCPHTKELFPAGRLDKDTEGLLLLTNDGALAHELLSPGKHVAKTYQVWVEGAVTRKDQELFARGMDIGDEKKTKPAKLEDICYYDKEGNFLGELQEGAEGLPETTDGKKIFVQTRLNITITEGRYHQIKRMFAGIGKPVQYLKRISMGTLVLDETLASGEFRKLTEEEIASLKG